MPVDERIALEAGRVQRRYRLSLPDALHLACARAAGAGVFVTNDRDLQRASTYLPVAILDELAGEWEGGQA